MIEWYKHLFWLIGWALWCLIRFDFKNCLDTIYWMNVHLSFDFSFVERKQKLSRKQIIKNFVLEVVGVLFFIAFLMYLVWLFNLIRNFVIR